MSRVLAAVLGSVLFVGVFVGVIGGSSGTSVVEISSIRPWPVQYVCISGDDSPLEQEVCEQFKVMLDAGGYVDFDYDPERPYFRFVVLPPEGKGLIAMPAFSTFHYPPLGDLAIAVFYGNFMIDTEELDLGQSCGYVATKMVTDSASWLEWAKDKLLRVRVEDNRYLEAGNG